MIYRIVEDAMALVAVGLFLAMVAVWSSVASSSY